MDKQAKEIQEMMQSEYQRNRTSEDKVNITIAIPTWLERKLRYLAKRENKSLSAMGTYLLYSGIKANDDEFKPAKTWKHS